MGILSYAMGVGAGRSYAVRQLREKMKREEAERQYEQDMQDPNSGWINLMERNPPESLIKEYERRLETIVLIKKLLVALLSALLFLWCLGSVTDYLSSNNVTLYP